jgi:hypothetical protein
VGKLELTCPSKPSDTGAYTLRWSGPRRPEEASFRLTENDRLLYEGPALATTVSGRLEGRYSYTLEMTGGSGSDSCVVQVQPPSISTAMFLFFLGLGVFLASLILIIRGHRAQRPS